MELLFINDSPTDIKRILTTPIFSTMCFRIHNTSTQSAGMTTGERHYCQSTRYIFLQMYKFPFPGHVSFHLETKPSLRTVIFSVEHLYMISGDSVSTESTYCCHLIGWVGVMRFVLEPCGTVLRTILRMSGHYWFLSAPSVSTLNLIWCMSGKILHVIN